MLTVPPKGYPKPRLAPSLYDEAKKKGWTVISMKNDWKQIFSLDK